MLSFCAGPTAASSSRQTASSNSFNACVDASRLRAKSSTAGEAFFADAPLIADQFMPSPERKSFLLRIDPKLWDELEAWAEQELRSINGQVEYLLRDAVKRR